MPYRNKVPQYINTVLLLYTCADPLGLYDARGVSEVAFFNISHKQTPSNRVCCFPTCRFSVFQDPPFALVRAHNSCRCFVCLFVLEFYGPVNNEVMSSRSVNSSTVPG